MDFSKSPTFDEKTIIVEEVSKTKNDFYIRGGSFKQQNVDPFLECIEGTASKNPYVTYKAHFHEICSFSI